MIMTRNVLFIISDRRPVHSEGGCSVPGIELNGTTAGIGSIDKCFVIFCGVNSKHFLFVLLSIILYDF